MASSTCIIEINGAAPGTITKLTSARYCTNDAVATGLNNPIPIPTAGVNYSFHKTHGLSFAGSAENYTWTQIDNIRWYTDGTIGWNFGATSGKLFVGTRDTATTGHGVGISGYIAASGTVGTTGLYLASAYPTYQAQSGVTNVTNFVVGTPLTVDTVAYSASGISKCVVTQVAVGTDASQGTQSTETITFRYDEI